MRPKLAAIASRQHGAFTRAQAHGADYTDQAIARRVRSGAWIRPHAGVYIDAAAPRTFEREVMAACLACGDGAAASHGTAAQLLGLQLPAPSVPHVTVPGNAHPRHPRIRVHRARHLKRHEVARVRNIPVTVAVVTIADLAGELERDLLAISLDTFWRRGLVDPVRLLAYLDRPQRRTRPGTAVLRALARERTGQRPPGSDLETIYMNVLARFSVPLPVRQHPVVTRSGRRFVDLAYPDVKVAIELEGFDPHGTDREVFEDDRVRKVDLDALGWRVIPYTWKQCTGDPVYVAVTTAAAIGLAPARWRRGA